MAKGDTGTIGAGEIQIPTAARMAWFNSQAAARGNGYAELAGNLRRAEDDGWRRVFIWDPFDAGVDSGGLMRWDGWDRLTGAQQAEWTREVLGWPL